MTDWLQKYFFGKDREVVIYWVGGQKNLSSRSRQTRDISRKTGQGLILTILIVPDVSSCVKYAMSDGFAADTVMVCKSPPNPKSASEISISHVIGYNMFHYFFPTIPGAKYLSFDVGAEMGGLVYSCQQGTNDKVFPSILKLYVKDGATITDTSYGNGVFWNWVDKSKYVFKPSHHDSIGVDFQSLPYEKHSIDAVVLDQLFTLSEFPDALLRIYRETIDEASRVLKDKGILILKCQDEDGPQLLSAYLVHSLLSRGWLVEDLFVVMTHNKADLSKPKTEQQHSRKNHSYFIVARKQPYQLCK